MQRQVVDIGELFEYVWPHSDGLSRSRMRMLFPQQKPRSWWKGGGVTIHPIDRDKLPWWTYYESTDNCAGGEAEIIIEPVRVYPHPLPRSNGVAWAVLCSPRAVDGTDPTWQHRTNIIKFFEHISEKDIRKLGITLVIELKCELRWNDDKKTQLYMTTTSQNNNTIETFQKPLVKTAPIVTTINAISPLLSSSQSIKLPTPPASPSPPLTQPIIREETTLISFVESDLYGNTADNGRSKEIMTRILMNAANMGIHVRSATVGNRPGQMIFTIQQDNTIPIKKCEEYVKFFDDVFMFRWCATETANMFGMRIDYTNPDDTMSIMFQTDDIRRGFIQIPPEPKARTEYIDKLIEIVRRLEHSPYPAVITHPAKITNFSWSIGTPHNVLPGHSTIPSVRIPASTYYNGHGYIEDHRPLAHSSPYLVGLFLLRGLATDMKKLLENTQTAATREDANFQRILLGETTVREVITAEILRLPRGFIPTRIFLGRSDRTSLAIGPGKPNTDILQEQIRKETGRLETTPRITLAEEINTNVASGAALSTIAGDI